VQNVIRLEVELGTTFQMGTVRLWAVRMRTAWRMCFSRWPVHMLALTSLSCQLQAPSSAGVPGLLG